ncbi:carboxymuconolactone decarboxylase family protein [Nocardioides sp. ChNu-153]|uniref:carboxymuconolactone decarboxylase family protein n=1 Tax=unclassified Nocardioides TaxID=2615069 RepID=UPI002406209E|nr:MULTISPECIES: carboxymuconolactone decarboxylase family protein [unclassified Nocardioides]MDF9715049.1 carboxymuconolactone decarboxylase family protein [Nocardioides sp. ChNu-99]MDN7122318.1 carboxymuconolactone decarboxylase family protein [Nocardioides sp. ChNu-153]
MGAPEGHEGVFLDRAEPEVYAALAATAKAVTEAARRAGLDRGFVELVNLRVSQLNGCAFCLDLHHRRALKAGEDPRRLAVLSVWEETALFDERERAALALAESVTRLPPVEERRAVEADARRVLGDEAYGAVAWIAVTINAFNRVSITSQHPVV